MGGCSLIGITDGDLATDESVTTSEAVDKHLKERLIAQECFRKNDADMRMKRIMKSKAPKYNDEIYQKGDKIWFQDKNNKWLGPAIVTEHDGRKVSFRYLGKDEETTSATHTC